MSQPTTTFRNLPDERQRRFLDGALEEFAAHGYQGASLNRLVERLGIAKGSVYRYFASKEDLFLHLFEDFVVQVKRAVKGAAANASDDFLAQVAAVCRAGVGFIDTNPRYFRLYQQVLFEPGIPRREELLNRVRLFSRDYFLPLCQAAQERGELRADVPAAVLVFVVDACIDRFLMGYASSYLDGGLGLAGKTPAELESCIDQITTVLRHGLAGAAGPNV